MNLYVRNSVSETVNMPVTREVPRMHFLASVHIESSVNGTLGRVGMAGLAWSDHLRPVPTCANPCVAMETVLISAATAAVCPGNRKAEPFARPENQDIVLFPGSASMTRGTGMHPPQNSVTSHHPSASVLQGPQCQRLRLTSTTSQAYGCIF